MVMANHYLYNILIKRFHPFKMVLLLAMLMVYTCANGQVNLGPADTTICAGTSITLDAGFYSQGNTYVWAGGHDQRLYTVSEAGTYSVTVQAADGNVIGSDQITVTLQAVNVNLGGDSQLCGGNSRTLDAGWPGSTYLWSTGAITNTITVTEENQYTVTVTTPEGCTGTGSAVVEVFDAGLNLGQDTYLCPDGEQLELTAQGGPDATYQWSTGATTQAITVTTPGTYSVTVGFPGIACTASDQITINEATEACDNKTQNISEIIIAQDPAINSYAQLANIWVEAVNNNGWVMGYYPVGGKNRVYVVQTDQYYRLSTLRIIGDYDGLPRGLSDLGHVAINYKVNGENRGMVIPYDAASDQWQAETTGSVFVDGFVTDIDGNWVSSYVYFEEGRANFGVTPWFVGPVSLQDFLVHETYYRGWRKQLGQQGEPTAFANAIYYNRESRIEQILADGTAVGYSHGSQLGPWLSNPVPMLRYRNGESGWRWNTAKMLNDEFGYGEAVNSNLEVAGRYIHPIDGQLRAFYSAVGCREFWGDYQLQDILPGRTAAVRTINNQGYVFGSYLRGQDDFRAYSWRSCDCEPGKLIDPTDLLAMAYPDLKWKLRSGIDLNDRNYAVGIAIDQNTGQEFAYRVKLPFCNDCTGTSPVFDYAGIEKVWNANEPIDFTTFFEVSGADPAQVEWYVQDRTTLAYNKVDDPTAYYFNLNGRDEWGRVKVKPATRCSGGGIQFFETAEKEIEVLDYGIYFFNGDGRMEKYSLHDTDGNAYYNPAKPTVLLVHDFLNTSVSAHNRLGVFGSNPGQTISKALDDGYNVAVYYWNQLSDTEPIESAPLSIETGIYKASVPGILGRQTWVHEGGFPRSRPDGASPSGVSLTNLFTQAYNEIGFTHRVRLVGHGAGGAMVLEGFGGLQGGILQRMALLDPLILTTADGPPLGLTEFRNNINAVNLSGTVIEWVESDYMHRINGFEVGLPAVEVNNLVLGSFGQLSNAALLGGVVVANPPPGLRPTPTPPTGAGPNLGGPIGIGIIIVQALEMLKAASINGTIQDIRANVAAQKIRGFVPGPGLDPGTEPGPEVAPEPEPDQIAIDYYFQGFGTGPNKGPNIIIPGQGAPANGIFNYRGREFEYDYTGFMAWTAATCLARVALNKGLTVVQMSGTTTPDPLDDLAMYIFNETRHILDQIPDQVVEAAETAVDVATDCELGPKVTIELWDSPTTEDDFMASLERDFLPGRVKVEGGSEAGTTITLSGNNLKVGEFPLAIDEATNYITLSLKNGEWQRFFLVAKEAKPMVTQLEAKIGSTVARSIDVDITADLVIYRGVNNRSRLADDARQGTVIPKGWGQEGGHASAMRHHTDGTNFSVFTSWSINQFVGIKFGTEAHHDPEGTASTGVLVKKRLDREEILRSPSIIWSEQEALPIGPVLGAYPIEVQRQDYKVAPIDEMKHYSKDEEQARMNTIQQPGVQGRRWPEMPNQPPCFILAEHDGVVLRNLAGIEAFDITSGTEVPLLNGGANSWSTNENGEICFDLGYLLSGDQKILVRAPFNGATFEATATEKYPIIYLNNNPCRLRIVRQQPGGGQENHPVKKLKPMIIWYEVKSILRNPDGSLPDDYDYTGSNTQKLLDDCFDRIEIYIDGVVIPLWQGKAADAQEMFEEDYKFLTEWTPPGAGNYILTARAFLKDGTVLDDWKPLKIRVTLPEAALNNVSVTASNNTGNTTGRRGVVQGNTSETAQSNASGNLLQVGLNPEPATFAIGEALHLPDHEADTLPVTHGDLTFEVPVDSLRQSGILQIATKTPQDTVAIPFHYVHVAEYTPGTVVRTRQQEAELVLYTPQPVQELTVLQFDYDIPAAGLPANAALAASLYSITTANASTFNGTLTLDYVPYLTVQELENLALYRWDNSQVQWVQAQSAPNSNDRTAYRATFTVTQPGTYAAVTLAPQDETPIRPWLNLPNSSAITGLTTVQVTGNAVHTDNPGTAIDQMALYAIAQNGQKQYITTGQPTDTGFVFTLTPPAYGTYYYYAVATAGTETGTSGLYSFDYVFDPNQPAMVSLVTPDTTAVLTAGQNVTLTALAQSVNAPVSSVNFYVNSALLGSQAQPVYFGGYEQTWVPAVAGTYYLFATATTATGLTTHSDTLKVAVQDAPGAVPAIAAIEGINNLNSLPLSVTGLGYRQVTVAYAGDKGQVDSLVWLANGQPVVTITDTAYTFDWLVAQPQLYSLQAQLYLNNGSVLLSTPVVLTVKNNLPPGVSATITSQSFEGGRTVTGNAFEMTITATDPDGAVDSVEIFLDHKHLNTLYAPPYVQEFTLNDRANHEVSVRAIDNSGQASAPFSLVVSANKAPQVSIVGNKTGMHLGESTDITLTATAYDADGVVFRLEVYRNNTLIGQTTDGTLTITDEVTSAGSYEYRALAFDEDRAYGISEPVNIQLNHPPRVTTDGAPALLYQGQAEFELTANPTDADGHIAYLRLLVNGAEASRLTAPPYRFALNLRPGTYSIQFEAADDLGSVTLTEPETIVVNAQPELNITAPALVHRNEPTVLTYTAADADGTIQQVEVYDNGVLWQTLAAPATIDLTALAAGNHTIALVAHDNQQGTTRQEASLWVNEPPVLGVPTINGRGFDQEHKLLAEAGTPLLLQVPATDADGHIARVAYTIGGIEAQAQLTNQQYSHTWQGLTPGRYALTATAIDNKGGRVTSTEYTLEVCPDCIPNTHGELTVWPNPFAGQVSLMYQLNQEATASLVLTDALGNRVQTVFSNLPQPMGLHQQQVQTGSLPAGLYFATLYLNGRPTHTKRLVRLP